MASYILRDENGVAKAKFDGACAERLFQRVEGHFEQRTYAHSGRKTVFVVDRDGTVTLNSLSIFLWRNDVMIP